MACHGDMVLKLFTTWGTWSYHSSIYGLHCLIQIILSKYQALFYGNNFWGQLFKAGLALILD